MINKYLIIKQFKLLLTIACIVLCYGCPTSPPIEYEYTFFPPDGYSSVFPECINNNGEVVGSNIMYGPNYVILGSEGFIYSGGNYTYILPEGWRLSYASTINDTGEVVGHGEDGDGNTKGFIYKNGTYTELLPRGWVNAWAVGINNNGQVVGWGKDSAGKSKGFICNSGKYTFIVPFDYPVSVSGINDSGEVTGCAVFPRAFYPADGFIYSNGTYTYLPSGIIPYGINNKGIVVGTKQDDFGVRGFIATPVNK